MTRLILSLAITAALALTACSGQSRAVKAAAPGSGVTAATVAFSADAAANTLDLGMIDAGAPAGATSVSAGSGAGSGTYLSTDACISQ